MLSLKYYRVVHRVDVDNYMQSLRSAQELNKNDFWHLMCVVRAKNTEEGHALPKIHQTTDIHESLMMMRKFRNEEQPSPNAKRFPTSIPPLWIPQYRHSSSEL